MQRHCLWMVAPVERWSVVEPLAALRKNPSLLPVVVRAIEARLVRAGSKWLCMALTLCGLRHDRHW
jgi:hypothetical protein